MKKKLAKVLGRLQFIVPNIKEMDIYVEIYKKLEDMTGKKKFEFIKISKEEIEKLKKVEIKKDITKYDQLNLENVKEYKERGNKTPVYVDSSPWGTGIFDTENYRMYQMKFPKSLQKLKRSAGFKEGLGYIASRLVNKKGLIYGDNQSIANNIFIKGESKSKELRSEMRKQNIRDMEWIPNNNKFIKIADAISRDIKMVEINYRSEDYINIKSRENIEKIGCEIDKEGNIKNEIWKGKNRI